MNLNPALIIVQNQKAASSLALTWCTNRLHLHF